MSYVLIYAFSPTLQRLRRKEAVRGKERKTETERMGKKEIRKKLTIISG